MAAIYVINPFCSHCCKFIKIDAFILRFGLKTDVPNIARIKLNVSQRTKTALKVRMSSCNPSIKRPRLKKCHLIFISTHLYHASATVAISEKLQDISMHFHQQRAHSFPYIHSWRTQMDITACRISIACSWIVHK